MEPNQKTVEEEFAFGEEETKPEVESEGPPLAPTGSVSDSLIKDSPEFIEATKDVVPLTAEERRLSKKQLLTKRHFDTQRRVPIFIPLEKGEVKGTQFYFATSGYKFYVPKGVRVEVPEEIADRYYMTIGLESAALTESKFNLSNASPEKMDRLTR